jgi:hypothetical protein
MKNLSGFFESVRIKVMLCCSGAALLSACGGGNADGGTGKAQLAAVSYSSPTGSSTMVAAEPAAGSLTPAVPDTTAAPATADFAMAGYGAATPAADSQDGGAGNGVAPAGTTAQAPSAQAVPQQ